MSDKRDEIHDILIDYKENKEGVYVTDEYVDKILKVASKKEDLETQKNLNESLIKENVTLGNIIKKVSVKNILFTNEECTLIDLIKGAQGCL